MYEQNRSSETPVIVQVRDAVEELAFVAKPSGSLTFIAVPTDEDTLTISDGVTETVYTFLDTLTGAANEIEIGVANGDTAAEKTCTNTLAALLLNAPDLTLSSGLLKLDPLRGIVPVSRTSLIIDLYNTRSGAIGNVAITTQADAGKILPSGMSDTVEISSALPATTTKTIPLERLCRTLTLSVPAGASCKFSTQGTATSASMDLDGSMLRTVRVPSGTRNLYVITAADMAAYRISIEGH